MTTQFELDGDPPRIRGARRWLLAYPRAVPIALFFAVFIITALGVYAIENNARTQERAELRDTAQTIANSLERRGTTYSSYLRAGAALFSNYEEVSPQLFRQFVAELRLDSEEAGTDGVGWIEVSRRASGTSTDQTPAAGQPERYRAIVTQFAPDNIRNRRALGVDMQAEPVRAAALDEARRTVSPTASGRVTIANQGTQETGFSIFMPVYRSIRDERELSGFLYVPFNASELLDGALERAGALQLGVRLYDGEQTPGKLLAERSIEKESHHRVEEAVTIGNRDFTLIAEATDADALTSLSMATLLFGLAVATLLLLLSRLLTQQALEDSTRLAFYEEQNSIRNSLTRELNHRVKNTLANVLSILSLTRRRTDNLDEFADSLQGRIRALSATHDLLTHSDWGTIPMREIIEAELQHIRTAQDSPVIIEGPDVELAPNDALSFGLAIHELATNAAKYGALSVPGGSVSARWSLIKKDLAQVVWTEEGGPEVSDERPRGFGTELIEKIVAHELRNPVQLDFNAEGVVCVLRVPIRRLSEFRIRQD